MSRKRSFSVGWVILSMVVFVVVELILGIFVGRVVIGRYMSIPLSFTMQGLLHLSSYLVGGFLVGAFSPGIRIAEPAIGAFCAVALMLSLTAFTPISFYGFSFSKLIVGGVMACLVAMFGAIVGERLMGNSRS